MKKYILIIPFVLISLAIILTIIFRTDNHKKHHTNEMNSDILYQLSDFSDVKQAIWRDTFLIINSNEGITEFNTTTLEKVSILAQSSENTVVGINADRDLFFCTYKELERNNPDEYSTQITISNISSLIKEFRLHPFVKLVSCNDKQIYALSGSPILEFHKYLIDVQKEEIIQVDLIEDSFDYYIYPYFITQNNAITVSRNQENLIIKNNQTETFKINTFNEFLFISISSDSKKAALIDKDYKLWLVEKRL